MVSGKRCLITTGIFDETSIGGDRLFLGPWCLAGKGKNSSKRPSLVPSPWRPSVKIKESDRLCHDIYESILPELCVRLNLLHEVSYPQTYWRVLIGPWLMYFISVFYERYRRIENAFTLFPDIYTYALPRSLCKIAVADTYDFANIRGKMTDDHYNLKLFSLITRHLYTDKVVDINIDALKPEKAPSKTGWLAKELFYNVKRLKDLFCRPDIILSDMYHFSPAHILSLELKARPNTVIFENFNSGPISAESDNYLGELRKALRLEETDDAFRDLLGRALSEAMPLCYVENFKKYKDNVKAKKVKAVGSAVGWYFNENFKFMAAESLLNGSKLMDFQHGGGYGMYLSSFPEDISLEKDAFYTWGWRAVNNKKTIPLPNPRLSDLKNTHKQDVDNILLVGNNVHKYLCRFTSVFTPDDVAQYFADKKRFFCSLNEKAKGELLYRPYQEVGWHEAKTVKELIPGIRLLPDGGLMPWLQKSKLVVIDYLCTTNLEALVINVPTIWFWDFNTNLVRPEVEKDFAMLIEAGILYAGPEEAAKKVNDIYDDPLGWWRDPKVQMARDVFCEKFAKTSGNWREEWIDALNAYK